MKAAPSLSTVDPAEVAKLSTTAERWWDHSGIYAALHQMNPVRLAFIREQALACFGRDEKARAPFGGLRLLDIGCGGGLLCEPMARLGFSVTGVDPSAVNVQAANSHAEQMGLRIHYQAGACEDLVSARTTPFDVVLNMEVVEHTADPQAFLADCASLVAPGGIMILSTLNRTLASLALAKIGAEYVLRWAAPGTHDWRRFLTPGELRSYLAPTGCDVAGPFGVVFDPLNGAWRRSNNAQVNYMMTAARPAAASA
jgi:2-polyprenyl-6-hydroxyphenyl methylase/3-demethylubiquinone-9 3-methyltransferase